MVMRTLVRSTSPFPDTVGDWLWEKTLEFENCLHVGIGSSRAPT